MSKGEPKAAGKGQALTDRLALARRTCDELRRWVTDTGSDKHSAQTRIKRLGRI